MGRNAKTTEEHKAAGTYRKCRHEETEADVTILRDYEPPGRFSESTKKLWRDMVGELLKMGLVAENDREILAHAFTNYEIAQSCLAQLDGVDFGVYLKTLNKVKDANLLDEYNAHMNEFNKILLKFAVTPEARARLRIKPKEKEPEDFLKELMGNG